MEAAGAAALIISLALGAVGGVLVASLIAQGHLRAARSRNVELDAERHRLMDEQATLRSQLSRAESDRAGEAARTERIPELEETLRTKEATLEDLHRQIRELAAEEARLKAELEREKREATEKLALLDQAEQKLREAFQALSAEALKSNNQAFLELARTQLGEFQQGAKADLEARQNAIDQLLTPIHESLDKVDSTIRDIETTRAEAYGELKQQVSSLVSTQELLKSETANLVKALRSPTVRGRWGELQLKRVVEMAGMLAYCDFREQESVESEDGKLRPDLVVKLPGGKNVVVDSKAPLGAYLESLEAPDDTGRESWLREHARQVRDHMTKLGSKAYWDQFDATPDFVVMFLPGETFFGAALQQDSSLIEYGVGQRVIPASPITLIALLRAIAYGWQQEKIAENARQISDLGRTLYDRLSVFAAHLENVGKNLKRAVDAYNSAAGSLERRVLVQARRFKELGAAAAAEDLPELPILDTTPQALPAENTSGEVADDD